MPNAAGGNALPLKLCACPNSELCMQNQGIIAANASKYGYPYTVLNGHCRLRSNYSWGDGEAQEVSKRTKQGQFHIKSMLHIYTETLTGMPKSTAERGGFLYFNKTHWPLEQLIREPDYIGKNSVPTTITVDSKAEADKLGLEHQSLYFGDDSMRTYYLLPTVPVAHFDVVMKECDKIYLEGIKPKNVVEMYQTIENNSFNFVDSTRRERLLHDKLEDHAHTKNGKNLLKSAQKRLREEEEEKVLRDQERAAKRSTFPKTVAECHDMIERLLAEKDMMKDDFEAELLSISTELERLKEEADARFIATSGFNRLSVFSDAYHAKFSNMALHLFGFQTYEEYKTYCMNFWIGEDGNGDDDSPINTSPPDPNGTGLTGLSTFHRLSIVKIILTRNLSFSLIASSFDIQLCQVTGLMKMYMPWWGEIGRSVHILSITDKYLEKSKCDAFIKANLANCDIGTDGKDIYTQRVGNAIAASALFSPKLHSEAVRILSFNSQAGLVMEATTPVGAKASEMHIMDHWGSCRGNTQLINNSELEDKTTALNKLMVDRDLFKLDTPKPSRGALAGTEIVQGGAVDFVDKYLAQCMMPKPTANVTAEERERRISIEKIRRHNMNILIHRGPDGDCKSKRKQIKVLLRLYNAYKERRLRFCLLSHYVFYMKEDLDLMLDCIDNIQYRSISLATSIQEKYKTRLYKFPTASSLIGDKGFAKCSSHLPNGNRVIHPHCLSKGTQFSRSELMHDKGVKEVRWKEESVFTRLTNETLLATIVPYHNMRYLEDAVSWALGRCNLCLPIYEPLNWDEIFAN